jgi:glycosyltransferase involved in cell wall biosynthesis
MPHKRLKEMLEMVREYGQARNIRCWVAGKTDMHAEPPIVMLGHLDEKRLNDYLSMSDVMLNLCWYDWCPNAVVEAICAGVPVICGNNGGVPEIVRDSGIILDIDTPMKPAWQKDSVPSIMGKKQDVFDALDYVTDIIVNYRPDLTAAYAAKQYYEFFKRTLECTHQ